MQDRLDAFRRLILNDLSLQAALGAITEPEPFIARAREAASAAGLIVSQEELSAALRPDPLALMSPPPVGDGSGWPPAGWLPIHVAPTPDGRGVVEWAYFGEQPLDAPFFEMSVRRARMRPINRLCRWRTALDDFLGDDSIARAPPPRGLIFHMSRCGSTLVAQMLAAVARNRVLSEAPPIDSVLRLRELRPETTEEDRRRALIAMVAALARGRDGAESRCILKLDSWHMMALPLFRAAFPSTPWVFLYRDPVEVLVSQMRSRGMQTVPGMLPRELQGPDDAATLGAEEFCAQALAQSCEAAVAHFHLGGGLLVAYEELPDAVFSKILPHLGLSVDAAEREAMRAATLRDAKAPHNIFSRDGEEKRRAATERVREAAARRLFDVHARLESMRARS